MRHSSKGPIRPPTMTADEVLAFAREEDRKKRERRKAKSGFKAPRPVFLAPLPEFLDNPRSAEGRAMLPLKPPGGRP